MAFQLTNEQIEENFGKFIRLATHSFPTRRAALMTMYEALELKFATAPASGTDYYHNAFPGGFLEHTLRVADFALKIHEQWESLDLDVSTFTIEELIFAALHHDIGKLGFPGDDNDRYVPTQHEWMRNRGVLYEANPNIPFVLVQHLSLFLLQQYGIPLSWNEYQSILIHDGLYEESNKSYLVSGQHKSRLRSSMAKILHQADLMAAQFEYERWASSTGSTLKNYRG